MHEIIVGNVGTVYYGRSETAAQDKYDSYAGKYKPFGCGWFAHVTWIHDNDIRAEFIDPTDDTDQ